MLISADDFASAWRSYHAHAGPIGGRLPLMAGRTYRARGGPATGDDLIHSRISPISAAGPPITRPNFAFMLVGAGGFAQRAAPSAAAYGRWRLWGGLPGPPAAPLYLRRAGAADDWHDAGALYMRRLAQRDDLLEIRCKTQRNEAIMQAATRRYRYISPAAMTSSRYWYGVARRRRRAFAAAGGRRAPALGGIARGAMSRARAALRRRLGFAMGGVLRCRGAILRGRLHQRRKRSA